MRYTNWQVVLINSWPHVQGEFISDDGTEKIITAWRLEFPPEMFQDLVFPLAGIVTDMGSTSTVAIQAPEGKRRFLFNRWTAAEYVHRVELSKEERVAIARQRERAV